MNYHGVLGDAPEILYHYCSLDTFIHIMQDRTLWLFDVSKSNDALELAWYINICKRIAKTNWDDYWKAQPATIGIKTEYQKRFDSLIKKADLCEVNSPKVNWTMCFSEEQDDLSQWRGYASDGAGISIGFKTEKLGNFGFLFDSEHSQKVMFDGLRKMTYCLSEVYNETEKLLNININDSSSPDERLRSFNTFINNAPSYAPWYKHESFAAEKEWRIALQTDKQTLNTIKYFDGGYGVIFKKAEFCEKSGRLTSKAIIEIPKMDEFVSSVCIGPKATVSIEDIRLFLFTCGFLSSQDDPRIRITNSVSSYR